MTLLTSACTDNSAEPIPDTPLNYPVLEPIRIPYGSDPEQFGELRMPDATGEVPVIMIIHGGCWVSYYDLGLMDAMAEELAKEGFATWNVEYRRIGNPGGGWPGTFTDVALALKQLKELAKSYPLDLDNILVTGHSAGGHLALMLGAQHRLPTRSEIRVTGLPDIRGIVSLAGITDLKTYYAPAGCGSNTKGLMGGLPNEFPERYSEGSPINHLPLGVRQILVNGAIDNIVPLSHVTPYHISAIGKRDPVELVTVPDAGHFEVITPGSVAWGSVVKAFRDLVR